MGLLLVGLNLDLLLHLLGPESLLKLVVGVLSGLGLRVELVCVGGNFRLVGELCVEAVRASFPVLLGGPGDPLQVDQVAAGVLLSASGVLATGLRHHSALAFGVLVYLVPVVQLLGFGRCIC